MEFQMDLPNTDALGRHMRKFCHWENSQRALILPVLWLSQLLCLELKSQTSIPFPVGIELPLWGIFWIPPAVYLRIHDIQWWLFTLMILVMLERSFSSNEMSKNRLFVLCNTDTTPDCRSFIDYICAWKLTGSKNCVLYNILVSVEHMRLSIWGQKSRDVSILWRSPPESTCRHSSYGFLWLNADLLVDWVACDVQLSSCGMNYGLLWPLIWL